MIPHADFDHATGLSPSLVTLSKDYLIETTQRDAGNPTNSTSRTGNQFDSKSGLFHLHSPLLLESLLFSFPPLTNMLKFGG